MKKSMIRQYFRGGRPFSFLIYLYSITGCSGLLDFEALQKGKKDASQQKDLTTDVNARDLSLYVHPSDSSNHDFLRYEMLAVADRRQIDGDKIDAPPSLVDITNFDGKKADCCQSDIVTHDLNFIDANPSTDTNTLDGKNIDDLKQDTQLLDTGTPDTFYQDSGPIVIPGTMINLKSGSFFMGAPESDGCRDNDETYHFVFLTRAFEISATEVTQKEFKDKMSYNPSSFADCGENCPVDSVSWHESVAYCNALSSDEKLDQCYQCLGTDRAITCTVATVYSSGSKTIYDCPGYRLPTEAEWEYAYRAGNDSYLAYYNGADDPQQCFGDDPIADDIGWYIHNSQKSTHPVGRKLPNAWGIYDMAGNIEEWVNDWYQKDMGNDSLSNPTGPETGTTRCMRGGSWQVFPRDLRGADRNGFNPVDQIYIAGFRCARTLPSELE